MKFFWRKVERTVTKGLWQWEQGSGGFFEFNHDFSPGKNRTPDPHLPPVLYKGLYCKTGKKGQYFNFSKVVRYDTVFSHKRTRFGFFAPPIPEIFGRKIAEAQHTCGSQNPEHLAGKVPAPGKGKMTGNMRSNNDIKGFIAEGCVPDICNKDPDPIRIRAQGMTTASNAATCGWCSQN
jgi:hypothetical protein